MRRLLGGIAGGTVDEQRTRLEAGEESVGPVEQRLDFGGRREAGDDDGGPGHRLARRWPPRARRSRRRAPWRAPPVRFHTVRGKRAATRTAIGRPIAPRPRKATAVTGMPHAHQP